MIRAKPESYKRLMRPSFRLPFVVAGVAIATVPLLWFSKTTGATADAQPGCPGQVTQINQAARQLDFSRSTAATIQSALSTSHLRGQTYIASSASLEQQVFRVHLNTAGRERIETALAQANSLLADQGPELIQAQSLVASDEHSVIEGATEIDAATQALNEGDCRMARRIALKAGWPKDSPFKELSEAARLNVDASSKLDAALDLILAAQHSVRLHGGSGSALR